MSIYRCGTLFIKKRRRRRRRRSGTL